MFRVARVCQRQLGFLVKVSNYLKKLSKSANPKVCLRCRVMTYLSHLNQNIQLGCLESGIKLHIWDVVIAV